MRKGGQHARAGPSTRATELIAHLKGREKALEPFDWTGRRAEWDRPGLSPRRRLHPRAVDGLPGCHPEKVRCAVLALVAKGLAVEEIPADGIHGIGRVCRIQARKVYGAGDFFRRRITSRDVLSRRLAGLHPEAAVINATAPCAMPCVAARRQEPGSNLTRATRCTLSESLVVPYSTDSSTQGTLATLTRRGQRYRATSADPA